MGRRMGSRSARTLAIAERIRGMTPDETFTSIAAEFDADLSVVSRIAKRDCGISRYGHGSSSGGTNITGPANEDDRLVASKVRELRTRAGLTGSQLAELIGVTCQQVHKYETAQNRISAGLLYTIAEALGCEPADFFPKAPPASEANDRVAALLHDTASLSREERHVVFDAARRLAAA